MKFSIITPVHKYHEHLLELYDSIKAQTYSNWEWVLYLNGDCKIDMLPTKIRTNNKVKIYTDYSEDGKMEIDGKKVGVIGYYKNKAFFKATGDILCEVDHDDLITSDCLEELNKAYKNSDIGFVYSDSVAYQDNFVPFNPEHGWSSYKYNFRDKDYTVMESWKPTSHSLAFIWYAPDHIRSWRKNVYEEVGGHNVKLNICDDHDLLIRTYLKTKMFQIKKPLYIYRIHGDNTWLERQDAIQLKTVELYHEYGYELAEKDADDRGLLKVDLGGGLNPRNGYTTIDQTNADINCNLNEGIPLDDNSVGVLNASHVLEHLKDPIKSMREIHRVLAHGGWAMIEVPSTDGRGAFQDPTHVSFWNEHSFWYYTNRDKAFFIRNEDIRFQTYRLNTWEMAPHIPVVTAWLVAIKDEERFPGILGI